jgi:hypothetical protein
LEGRLVRGVLFLTPGLSFMWQRSICPSDLACRCPRCLRLSLPLFPGRISGCGPRSRKSLFCSASLNPGFLPTNF